MGDIEMEGVLDGEVVVGGGGDNMETVGEVGVGDEGAEEVVGVRGEGADELDVDGDCDLEREEGGDLGGWVGLRREGFLEG